MSEVVFRGYLYKSPPESFGSGLKPWRMRWCVLADSRLAFPFATPYVRLEYYTNEHDANELDEPKGVIDLKDCNEVVDRRPMKGYDHVFDLCTDKRAYHFAASSIEVKNVWMESLTAVLRNKTESLQVDSTINIRLGVGETAGDISMESPIYSPLRRLNNTSENEQHVPRHAQEDKRERAQLPVDDSEDQYHHLQHQKLDSSNPPPVKPGTSANYDSLTRSFMQEDDDDVDDYQHLNHKKYSQSGDRAATISTSTALYDRLNRGEHDDYNHLHQRPATVTSVASTMYSSLNLDMKDDYQRLDNCTIRPNKSDNQSTKYSANTDTSYYSLPRVPAVPARRPKYGIVPLT